MLLETLRRGSNNSSGPLNCNFDAKDGSQLSRYSCQRKRTLVEKFIGLQRYWNKFYFLHRHPSSQDISPMKHCNTYGRYVLRTYSTREMYYIHTYILLSVLLTNGINVLHTYIHACESINWTLASNSNGKKNHQLLIRQHHINSAAYECFSYNLLGCIYLWVRVYVFTQPHKPLAGRNSRLF